MERGNMDYYSGHGKRIPDKLLSRPMKNQYLIISMRANGWLLSINFHDPLVTLLLLYFTKQCKERMCCSFYLFLPTIQSYQTGYLSILWWSGMMKSNTCFNMHNLIQHTPKYIRLVRLKSGHFREKIFGPFYSLLYCEKNSQRQTMLFWCV